MSQSVQSGEDVAVARSRHVEADQSGNEVLRSWGWVAASMTWVLVAVGLLLSRQTGVASYDTIWAEDGREFLHDGLEAPITSIGKLYAGYLHFVPRLIGLVADLLPIEAAAMVFAAGSSLVVALMSLYVFFASEWAISSRWLRAALAGSVILLPAGGYEVSTNATNLHWYLMFGCFWALLDQSVIRRRLIAGAAMVLAAALSNPTAALLLPVAVWQLVQRRSPKERTILWVYFAGLAVQAVLVLWGVARAGMTNEEGLFISFGGNDWSEIPRLYGLGVSEALLVSERLLSSMWERFGWSLAYLTTALFAFLAVAIWWRHPRREIGLLGPVLFGLSVLYFVVPVAVRGSNAIDTVGETIMLLGVRYVVLPMLFLTALVLMALDRWTVGSRRFGEIVFGVALLAIFALSFQVTNLRSFGPRWEQAVREAKWACNSGQDYVRVPIAPGGEEAGWYLDTSCHELIR